MDDKSMPTYIPFPKSQSYLSLTADDELALVPTYYCALTKVEPVSEGSIVKFEQFAAAIECENMDVINNMLQNKIENLLLLDPITHTNILHVAAKHPSSRLWTALMLHTSFEKYKNQPDIRGTTPLIAAVYYDNITAVKILLEMGAITDAFIIDTKKTALHLSAELDSAVICGLILKSNKNRWYLNLADWEGSTPLMISVIAHTPCWKVLLKNKSDFKRASSNDHRNVLHLATVYSNYEVASFLISNVMDTDFLNLSDVNSHTPFNLALLTGDGKILSAFLGAPFSTTQLLKCQSSLHYLVKNDKIAVLDMLIHHHPQPSYYDVSDENGKTLLMYAVELHRTYIVKALIDLKVNFKKINYITGETVLHVAVYANDFDILNLILGIRGIEQIIDIRDNSNTTAFEVVLRKAGFKIWSRFMQSGLISRNYQNVLGESSLFIAAKEGNYMMLLTILLSPRLLKQLEDTDGSMSKEELLEMEAKGILYPSDIYVTLGIDFGHRGLVVNPMQGFLFQHSKLGQNIFHACAMGASLQALSFIYDYCGKFNVGDPSMHEPDNFGNTPLLLAINGGNVKVAHFFLKKGCDITHKNKFGWNPLAKIGTDNSLREMYNKVINESLYTDYSEKKLGEMTLNFSVLCPLFSSQMTVVKEIFNSLVGPDNAPILSNPIIEYFIIYKWMKIKKIIALRLLLNGLLAAFFSTYLSFKYSEFIQIHDIIFLGIRYITISLSILIILYNGVISIVMKKVKIVIVYLIAPITTLLYFFAENDSRVMLEVGAVAILASWICFLIQGHVTKLSFQVAMLLSVMKAIIKYLPICMVVLIAFSLCFFTLFHDYFSYNNPLHAFITTSLYLREGEREFPMFPGKQTVIPIHNGREVFEAVDPKFEKIKGTKEMRNILIEGLLILFFEVIVAICVYNMLIGLAVRSGEEIENEGKIHKLRIYSEELAHWEHLVNTSVFRCFRKWHLLWLIGLPHDLAQKLTIPMKIKPLHNRLEEFDLHTLRFVKVQVQDEEVVKCLNDLINEEELEYIRKTFRRGSKAATDWAFLIKSPTQGS